TAGYEIDLWGRLRATTNASEYTVLATRQDVYTALQSIAGQVVLTWLDLVQAERLLEVTREQIAANRTTLELIELRFRKGVANALDVFQQREIVAQTATFLPPLEAQRDVLQHQLALLLGKAPRS